MTAYEIITNTIIEKLEKGTVPWKKSWVSVPTRNFITNKPYRGINKLLTSIMGYSSPYWLTFAQAKSMKISIKPGMKSTPIVFYSNVTRKKRYGDVTSNEEDETGQQVIIVKMFPILKYYYVFNLEQTDFDLNTLPPTNDNETIVTCESIITSWKSHPEIIRSYDTPSYSPSKDCISMPDISQFISSYEYYSTLYHELVHSTGHEKRLNRKEIVDIVSFGDNAYSQEELIAEIGSSFLCDAAGISNNVISNQAAYIAGWLSSLRNDKSLLIKAANKAQLAADYILSNTVLDAE